MKSTVLQRTKIYNSLMDNLDDENLFTNEEILTRAEKQKLFDAIDVINDAKEYADLWIQLDREIGLSKIKNEHLTDRELDRLISILSLAYFNVSDRNLYRSGDE